MHPRIVPSALGIGVLSMSYAFVACGQSSEREPVENQCAALRTEDASGAASRSSLAGDPVLVELLRQTVRYVLETRDLDSGLPFDALPRLDGTPTLQGSIVPQLAQSRPWFFPDDRGISGQILCDGTPSAPMAAIWRIDVPAGAPFAGGVWPAMGVDLSGWETVTVRFRLNKPGGIEFKLNHGEPSTPEAVTLLTYSGSDWQERTLALKSAFPSADLTRVNSLVFGFSDAQTPTDTPVQLDIARIVFTPSAARATRVDVTCFDPAGDRGVDLPYPDLACRESTSGVDKLAFALLLAAAADHLGLEIPGFEARTELKRMLRGMSRIPRWNGHAVGEPFGARGLPPNWFGVSSGILNPRDKHLSLTDSADLVAAMMVLKGAYQGVDDEIYDSASAEAADMLDAAGAILRPDACSASDAAHGAFLPGRDATGNEPGHFCGEWLHRLRQNDTLLGTFLGWVNGVLPADYWVEGLDWCPTSDGRCASGGCVPSSAGLVCESHGCTIDSYPKTASCDEAPCWYEEGGPAGSQACSCSSSTPPGMEAGGLFLTYKALLFLYGDGHPALARRALPLGFQSLAASASNMALAQIQFAAEHEIPWWGWSNAASPEQDRGYLGGCCVTSRDVTPHAALLAIEHHPQEVTALVERYLSAGVAAPFRFPHGACADHDWGLRDSARVASDGTLAFADQWLMLDQGLLGLSLVNYLTGGWLRDRFDRGGGRSGYMALARVEACPTREPPIGGSGGEGGTSGVGGAGHSGGGVGGAGIGGEGGGDGGTGATSGGTNGGGGNSGAGSNSGGTAGRGGTPSGCGASAAGTASAGSSAGPTGCQWRTGMHSPPGTAWLLAPALLLLGGLRRARPRCARARRA